MDFSPLLLAQRQKIVHYQDELVWTAWFCPVMSFTWIGSAGKKQRLTFLQTSAWCAGQALPGSSTSPHSEQSPGWPIHLAYMNFSLCKAVFSLKGDVEVTTVSFPATQSSHTPPLFPINCKWFCSTVLSFFRDYLGYNLPSAKTCSWLSIFSHSTNAVVPSYFWGNNQVISEEAGWGTLFFRK